MTKAYWVVLFAILFAASICSAGQMGGRPYAGGGLLYSVERFGDDGIGDDDDDGVGNLDFDNSWGLFAKGGYFILDYLAVEGLFRYHHEYKADLASGGVSADLTIRSCDLTLNVKGFLPIDLPVLFYGVVGGGYAQAQTELDLGGSDSDDQGGGIARAGAGADYFVSDNVGIEAEVTYNHCFNDLEDMNFIDINVGVIYAF
jgi:opacity protein-like surface antigen